MSQSPPLPPAAVADLARWREAWRLRRAHPRWVVIWAPDASQYGAYRLSRARRDTVLAAGTPEALAALIKRAEQAETRPRFAIATWSARAVTRGQGSSLLPVRRHPA